VDNRPIIPVPGNGPYRILVLDRNPDDPKWLIATVTLPTDVRPARLDAGGRRYLDWQEVCEWACGQVGERLALHTVTDPLVWTCVPLVSQ